MGQGRFQQNQNHNLVVFVVVGWLFVCFFRLIILGSFLYALRSFCVVYVCVCLFVFNLLTVNTSRFSYLSILRGNFCQALDQV